MASWPQLKQVIPVDERAEMLSGTVENCGREGWSRMCQFMLFAKEDNP